MRRIGLAITTLLLLASCKNDEIMVNNLVSFEVNPSTVVSGFYHANDVAKLDAGMKLRTRLLIYDTQGVLVDSDMQYLDGYSDQMKSQFELNDGLYIAIAITDVIGGGIDEDIEWEMKGENHLATLKVVSPHVWNSSYQILGVADYEFHVSLSSDEQYHVINVEPAGSLVYFYLSNIRALDTILSPLAEEYGYQSYGYKLLVNKIHEHISFDLDGTMLTTITSSDDYDWRLSYIVPNKYESHVLNIYGYRFMFPLGKVSFKWGVSFDDLPAFDLFEDGGAMDIVMGKGEEWSIRLDLATGEETWGIINNTKNAIGPQSDDSSTTMERITTTIRSENRDAPQVIELGKAVMDKWQAAN